MLFLGLQVGAFFTGCFVVESDLKVSGVGFRPTCNPNYLQLSSKYPFSRYDP